VEIMGTIVGIVALALVMVINLFFIIADYFMRKNHESLSPEKK